MNESLILLKIDKYSVKLFYVFPIYQVPSKISSALSAEFSKGRMYPYQMSNSRLKN